MSKLHIDTTRCKGCGYCIAACPKKALSFSETISEKGIEPVQADEERCIQCGACYRMCPDYVFEIY